MLYGLNISHFCCLTPHTMQLHITLLSCKAAMLHWPELLQSTSHSPLQYPVSYNNNSRINWPNRPHHLVSVHLQRVQAILTSIVLQTTSQENTAEADFLHTCTDTTHSHIKILLLNEYLKCIFKHSHSAWSFGLPPGIGATCCRCSVQTYQEILGELKRGVWSTSQNPFLHVGLCTG